MQTAKGRKCHGSRWVGAFLLLIGTCRLAYSQEAGQVAAASQDQRWAFHFQSTLVGQGVLPFSAGYSGANSLESHGEAKNTFSLDVTGTMRLWRGGEFAADLLSWQGYGLSKTTGVAGFPNGEAFRVGKSHPDAAIARAYFQQTIDLGGGQAASGGPSPGGLPAGADRIILTIGRFSATDIFDKNTYAGDARTQFMNWCLVSSGAWDYPANVIGFTNGATAELDLRAWAVRAGIFQVSRVANGMRLDWNVADNWSLAGELERRLSFDGHPGAVRLLAYKERAHLGNYQESLSAPQDLQLNGLLRYRTKYGLGINLEQEIGKDVGAFARLGWNDGRNQIWEFTDVDRTASAGISLKGELWRRPGNTMGVAAIVNGISGAHRQFLGRGGLGLTVGDGRLNYANEKILETYYSIPTRWNVSVSPDFQLVANPAYNRDRGPAPIFALRLHWEK